MIIINPYFILADKCIKYEHVSPTEILVWVDFEMIERLLTAQQN